MGYGWQGTRLMGKAIGPGASSFAKARATSKHWTFMALARWAYQEQTTGNPNGRSFRCLDTLRKFSSFKNREKPGRNSLRLSLRIWDQRPYHSSSPRRTPVSYTL